MPATIGSPNPDNYYIGKGIITFKPDGAAGHYHVGNVPEFEFTPAIEKLDHFSSMEGIRTKDKSIVIERSAAIRMVMEEWTPRNLSIILMGAVDDSGPQPTIDIFSTNIIGGELKFYGTNDVGPRWNFTFPRVEFSPSGSLNPISDEWGQIEVTGEVVISNGVFGTGTYTNVAGTDDPLAIGVPTISGFMAEDEVLTAQVGAWVGAVTYAYEWSVDEVAGATTETITLAAADAGKKYTVEVTATNPNGDTVAVSEPRWFGVPVNTVNPAITGTAQEGETLTVSNGTWLGVPTFTRQWKADGVAIPGATATTYVPVVGDIGAILTVEVSATTGGGVTSETTAATSAVLAA